MKNECVVLVLIEDHILDEQVEIESLEQGDVPVKLNIPNLYALVLSRGDERVLAIAARGQI